jgi:hypothetical protein
MFDKIVSEMKTMILIILCAKPYSQVKRLEQVN